MSGRAFQPSWRQPRPKAVRAKGVYIYDADGREYLDAVGGVYTANIGHGVASVASAMAAQAEALSFAYAGAFTSDAEVELADAVLEMAPETMDAAYFVSGGSEANEVAIKLARKYQIVRGRPGRWRIVGRWSSYHGATMTLLAVGGNTGRRADFAPYMADFPHIAAPNCYRCPLGFSRSSCETQCAEELQRAIEREGTDTIAAFICEPIGGATSGAVVPPKPYYRRIREICDEHDILMIADEVITGFGRTGASFALDHYGVEADLITCAKGMGAGYAPLGAVLISQRVREALQSSQEPGVFTGYTYSGHPVACAAGLAVLRYVRAHSLVEHAREEGAWFQTELGRRLSRYASVGDVRGLGLLAAVEFVADRTTKSAFPPELAFAARVVAAARERGVILRSETGTADGVLGEHVMLAPPLVAKRQHLGRVISVLSEAIDEVESRLL